MIYNPKKYCLIVERRAELSAMREYTMQLLNETRPLPIWREVVSGLVRVYGARAAALKKEIDSCAEMVDTESDDYQRYNLLAKIYARQVQTDTPVQSA